MFLQEYTQEGPNHDESPLNATRVILRANDDDSRPLNSLYEDEAPNDEMGHKGWEHDEAPMDEMEFDELISSSRGSISPENSATLLPESEISRHEPQIQLELSDSEDEELELEASRWTTASPSPAKKTTTLVGATTPSTVSLSPRSLSGNDIYSEASSPAQFLSTIPCAFDPSKRRTHRRAHTDGGNAFQSSVFSRSARSPHERFKSVLDRPFRFWKGIDSVLESTQPDWSTSQRGRLIHHLIHFLELKIGFHEYIPAGLLLPSPVVDRAWMALVLETKLYKKVTRHIQDFHGKPRKSIHYSMLAMNKGNQQERLKHTQELFQLYFREMMPVSIEDESMPWISSSSTVTQPPFPAPTEQDSSVLINSPDAEALHGLAVLNMNEASLPAPPFHPRHQIGTM